MKFFIKTLILLGIFLSSVPTFANTVYTIDNANINPTLTPNGLPGDFGFYAGGLPDLFFYFNKNNLGKFELLDQPDTLNTSAIATGEVFNYNKSSGFSFQISFFDKVSPNDINYIVSTHLELLPQVYTNKGGFIDPNNWEYFNFALGIFKGLGDYQNKFHLWFSVMHPPQLGFGANGKNETYGLSGWGDFYDINDRIIYPSDINWNLTISSVPIPSTFFLFILGGVLFFYFYNKN